MLEATGRQPPSQHQVDLPDDSSGTSE